MKLIYVVIFLFLFFVCFSGETEKGAVVKFKKEGGKVTYSITIKESFKKNKEAPFKFELKKGGNILKKVAWNEFIEKPENSFSFSSESGEDNINYWFIVCKYKDGKQINCQTITLKETIN